MLLSQISQRVKWNEKKTKLIKKKRQRKELVSKNVLRSFYIWLRFDIWNIKIELILSKILYMLFHSHIH